ncbi:MAG: hypothetical protein PHC29_02295 [Candidatus Omnitrophica bacterium]|nr:hypothetical protein [Candidatus Omnitrophota bacterium]
MNRVLLLLIVSLFFLSGTGFAQVPDELEFNLDSNSPTVSLPNIYKSNIDLSGRGAHRDIALPQTIAAKDARDLWQVDLGFNNFYRLQYNLWEIQQLAGDQTAQAKLLGNYEEIIKKISDSGGTVILNLFGTPNGLGRVLDRNSAPHNLKAYKELVKNTIRKLSCQKKYNIWYEVWSAPDLEDFFLGERSEYLNLYRVIAEAVKELRQETKMNIPLGGPSVSAWFRNIQPNNILSPEGSLIYELIKYCYSYRLPLDFISWHAYSSDPQEEKQDTIYNKSFIKLIREWLSYFHFDNNIPLVVDEWNFDGIANMSPRRDKDSYICASYIPSRLKNMYEAQIDYQVYFSLEDFGGNNLGATRNVGVFSFDTEHPESKSHAKASYNVFRMLNLLGKELFVSKFSDEFVGVIPTKSPDYLAFLIYSYIDPQAAMNYLSRKVVYLNSADRKAVLGIVKSDRMQKILSKQLDIATLRLSAKVKEMFGRAIELNNLVNKFSSLNRKIKISIKGLKDTYIFSRYIVDNKCSRDCEFKPKDEKVVDFSQGYIETVELSPYSVQLLVFKKKPAAPPVVLDNAGQTTTAASEIKPEEKALETKPAEVKPAGNPPEVKPADKAETVETRNAENK